MASRPAFYRRARTSSVKSFRTASLPTVATALRQAVPVSKDDGFRSVDVTWDSVSWVMPWTRSSNK